MKRSKSDGVVQWHDWQVEVEVQAQSGHMRGRSVQVVGTLGLRCLALHGPRALGKRQGSGGKRNNLTSSYFTRPTNLDCHWRTPIAMMGKVP